MRGCIADGILLNPTLNSDCSGLYAGWWFCVGIPTTSAAEFGWTTTDAPANVPTFTGNYTFTTLPEVNSTFKAEPTQTGIVGGCLSYYQAQDGETYRNIVDGHYLTQEDFMAMNPALNGNCDGLWLGYYYCVVGPSGITAMPPTATSPPHRRRLRSRLAKPASVVIGTSAMASQWDGDRIADTCDSIILVNGLDSNVFYQWNPAIGSGTCDSLTPNFYVCVAAGGSASLPPSTTTTSPTSTTTSAITTPTQSRRAWYPDAGGSTRRSRVTGAELSPIQQE
ncbi:hypothetical protein F4819DRAFT_484928 [Hypoxylon fuscum]|nr:hypothetical protein F4819DRAFT_484928 [Hypoxylon fuscum]